MEPLADEDHRQSWPENWKCPRFSGQSHRPDLYARPLLKVFLIKRCRIFHIGPLLFYFWNYFASIQKIPVGTSVLEESHKNGYYFFLELVHGNLYILVWYLFDCIFTWFQQSTLSGWSIYIYTRQQINQSISRRRETVAKLKRERWVFDRRTEGPSVCKANFPL